MTFLPLTALAINLTISVYMDTKEFRKKWKKLCHQFGWSV